MTISMADLQWMGRGARPGGPGRLTGGCRAPPPPAGAATQGAGRVENPAAPEAQLHAPTVTLLVQSREGVARAVCDPTVTFTRPFGPIRPDGPVDRLRADPSCGTRSLQPCGAAVPVPSARGTTADEVRPLTISHPARNSSFTIIGTYISAAGSKPSDTSGTTTFAVTSRTMAMRPQTEMKRGTSCDRYRRE